MFVGEPFHMVFLKGLKQYLNKNLNGRDMWKKYGKEIFAPIVAIKQDWRLKGSLVQANFQKSLFQSKDEIER